MKSRSLTYVATLTVALLSITGCSGSGTNEAAANCTPVHKFETLKAGKLTVVSYDLPPFSKITNGALSGVDGDLITEIAKMECLEVVGKSMATAANIPEVQTGRADASVAAWYRTEGRNKIVGLSDPIYTDQMAIVSRDGFDTIEELAGKTVGTVDGYLWADDAKRILGDSLKVYPTTLNMNQDLAAGRIDIGIDSYGSGVYNLLESFTVKPIKPNDDILASKEAAQIAVVVPQNNKDMLAAINEDIKTLRENGTLDKILEANGLDASAADTGPARLLK